jgi:hypothetical protein
MRLDAGTRNIWYSDVSRKVHLVVLALDADKVDGAAMAPPQLTGYAPILNIIEPPVPVVS